MVVLHTKDLTDKWFLFLGGVLVLLLHGFLQ